MKNVFLITSALGHEYGVFDYKQRLAQVKETINSIKYHDPSAQIYLVDASDNELPKEDLDEVFKMITDIMLLREHPYIIQFREYDDSKDSNRFLRKTLGELVILNVFLKFLKDRNMTDGRLFKITGRHQLNKDFSVQNHLEHKDKIVVQKIKASDDASVYNTRLWSADLSMMDSLIKMAEEMHIFTFKTLQESQLINIIEHSMYTIVNELGLPHETIDKLGVEGFFGQDGAPFSD